MEQALVRFGRFVNDMEGGGKGQKYIELAKFLLDSRYVTAVNPDRDRSEYDQSHLPVVEQYEAVGHAVRAVYTYSGMADVSVETHDPDYQSAVKSLWDNLVNKKYYITGGVGSGETSEGFGPNYSLGNPGAYCEACATSGEIFFQWKMNLAYHDAKYVDLYEDSMYNALMGATDLAGKNFYYRNHLDANAARSPWDVCPCCGRQHSANAVDAADVDVCEGGERHLREPLFVEQHDHGGECGRHGCGDGAGDQLSVERQSRDYGKSQGREEFQCQDSSAEPKCGARSTHATPDVGGLTSLAVNGKTVTPKIENGYAVISRAWKSGDKIELVVPMKPQRVKADEKVAADRGKVALRYGPLVYNIEKADQEIAGKTLSPSSPLATEWRGDLLGGVMTIQGKFTDGSPMMAIPNFARTNREPPMPPAPAPPPVIAGAAPPPRPAPRPMTSVVWIAEG